MNLDNFEDVVQGFSRTRHNGPLLDKVLIRFYQVKGEKKPRTMLSLTIGKYITTQLGLKEHDHIRIMHDRHRPLVWFIKKAGEGENTARKLTAQGAQLRVMLTWNSPIPEGLSTKNGFCNYNIWNGGMLVYLPGCPQEDRIIPV